MSEVKGQKIRAFYTEERREKPEKKLTRHFIHSEASGGFWAHIRDFSQKERTANEAVGHETVVKMRIGYNERFLDLWEKLTIIDERGQTYTLKEKPDEFDYDKGDIKFMAYAFRDGNVYEGDVYD